MGRRPGRVVLTHPANWTAFKIDLLRQAAVLADLADVATLTEPEAAATSNVRDATARPATVSACTTSAGNVRRVHPAGRQRVAVQILGRPRDRTSGGIDFDEAVFRQAVRARSSGMQGGHRTDADLRLARPADPAQPSSLALGCDRR